MLTRGFPNFSELFGSLIRWTHQYTECSRVGEFSTRFVLVEPGSASIIAHKLEKLGYAPDAAKRRGVRKISAV